MSLSRPLLATQIVHHAHVPLGRCHHLASDVACMMLRNAPVKPDNLTLVMRVG